MSDAPNFSEEQKQYLDGFLSGIAARRSGVGPFGSIVGGSAPPAAAPVPSDIHVAAQDRFLAAGKKLTAEEEAKRKGHPLDMWDELRAGAATDGFPKGTDIFRHKFFGLFYVAPAQNSFMCRLRMPNGILAAHQVNGIADIAERCGGGYADLTTRANLQIREIRPKHIIDVLTSLQDLGLTSRGTGADNIRNVTGSPTAGIDPQELIDTRPLAHELHHYILNHRELYGLPRKFNIAFDGGGQVSVLEDTNDIGFAAVAVGPGEAVPEGVYFRMQLGGITGHGDFARDTGIVLKPEECLPVAVAVLRVFIAHGDRTDRNRARLKYVLDSWGHEKFTAEIEKELGRTLTRLPLAACRARGPILKHGHVGVHRQKQPGLNRLGIVLPVGRVSAAQLRGLARIATEFGSATIRLTVWQNLLISDVADELVAEAQQAIEGLGLGTSGTTIHGALVACTGNTGCKFAATDTKGQAMQLADYLEQRVLLDQPVSIHLTGCPHSCAQHYVGDIGLLGVKVGDDMVEGYTVVVGGGAGEERLIAREIYPQVPMEALPARVAEMLRGYLAHRRMPAESFHDFTKRHSVDELKELFAPCREIAA